MSVITLAKNFLTRAFPVPKFLLLSNISVSISDGELSFFEFKNSGNKLSPKSYGKIPIPEFRVNKTDEKQKLEIISTLGSFAKENNISLVHALIHDADSYVFRMVIPTTNIDEFRSAIESVLEENVPIPPAEACFEYDIIFTDFVRGETSVAVSVISDKIISEYIDIFTKGNLTPMAFETEARAMSRAIFSSNENNVSLVLVRKKNRSMIFISENGHVVFSSSIDFGSTDIFSSLHDEIGRVLVFWKAQEKKIKDFRDISRIVLVGGDSIESDFSKQISASFKLPVTIGSVWTNVLSVEENVPNLSMKDSLDYGPSIGALLS